MTILATIVVLGVLIFVHELGHFLAAKAVGIEVQRFSIGLGPRIVGFRRGETEYVLSWIPLGGYVKMGGMDDEVMERVEGGPAEGEREPSPRDFDSKPIWARTLVISAGVIMNFLFAFVAYAAAAGFWGYQEPDTTRVAVVEEAALPPGAGPLAAVERGQRIARVAGRPVENWADVRESFRGAPAGPFEVELADPPARLTVDPPEDAEARERLVGALGYWIDPVVGMVNPGSPADRGGLREGDRIVQVAGEPIETWDQFVARVQERAGERTMLVISREGRRLERAVTPEPAAVLDPVTGEEREVGQVGIIRAPGDVVYSRVGPVEALQRGWELTVQTTAMILGFLADLVTGGVSPRSVGSIVTIGEASGDAAAMGMAAFLNFMALFSVNLAILNLLPIPVLDGGHLLFLAIEAVRGKALSVEQRMKWSNVGFLIIMGLMLWALSNDVLRLFGV